MILLMCCVAVIVAGLLLLAIDRWRVRADDPPRDTRLDDVAARYGLERIMDAGALQAAGDLIVPFDAISGQVVAVDAVMRRTEPAATLWLVGYRSRALGPRLPSGTRSSIELPLLAIMIELEREPDWPSYRAGTGTTAPPGLPAAWQLRLAAMGEYRMGIEGRVVGFFSQPRGSAMMQMLESDTSVEFHPGLLNSALAVDVQRALDVFGALPQAPALARFMRFEAVDAKLPPIDRTPLDRMAATQQKAAQETRIAAERAVSNMEEGLAEVRRRAAADREKFQQRMDELNRRPTARDRQLAAEQSSAASASQDDAASDHEAKSPPSAGPGSEPR